MAERAAKPGLALVVLSGEYERVHYALAMAAAAAAIGRPATLFLTNHALHAFRAGKEDAPGWHALQGDAQGHAAAGLDRARLAAGAAGFDELLESCAALGVRMIACEMGLRVAGIEAAALRTDLPIEVAGLVTLYVDMPDGAQLVTL